MSQITETHVPSKQDQGDPADRAFDPLAELWDAVRFVLTPIASLKITVVLMGMSMFLILAGTVAQVDKGIWTVLDEYFRTPIAWIPLSVFLPRSIEAPAWAGIYFPGGYVLGTAMLINLLAAHLIRFKMKADSTTQITFGLVGTAIGIGFVLVLHDLLLVETLGAPRFEIPKKLTALFGPVGMLGVCALFYVPLVIALITLFQKRTGIMLIHAAIVLLLVGEGITAGFQEERRMAIYTGQSSNYLFDLRDTELAIIDHSAPLNDKVIAIPQSILEDAAEDEKVIKDDDLPFEIEVETFYSNAAIFNRDNPDYADMAAASTHGFGTQYAVMEASEAPGVSSGEVNIPAIVARFTRGEQDLGQFLLTPHFQYDDYRSARQTIEVDGKPYGIYLRLRREYQPYSMHLEEFRHDLYPGTNTPKNFSSQIVFTDIENQTQRNVFIKMNHPFRTSGLTFFQSGWIEGRQRPDGSFGPDRGTVLQVVRNPGAAVPYIACTLGAIGLVFHFVLALAKFLSKQAKVAT